MKKALKKASSLVDSSEDDIRKHIHHDGSAISFYGNSIHKKDNTIISVVRDHKSRFLLVFSPKVSGNFVKFAGEKVDGGPIVAKKCPLNEHNAVVLREIFPWTVPMSLKNKKTAIGCGDRLNLAAPGHIAALNDFDAFPVLIQHSIKQLKLTQRTFKEVIDDTTFLVYQSGYKDGFGADGNQLKTISDINIALAAGIPMITLGLESLNKKAMKLSRDDINNAFAKLPAATRTHIEDTYFEKTFNLKKGTLRFDMATAKRCAVMYGKAVGFVLKAYEHIQHYSKNGFDLEISLTDKPWVTLPEDHLYIANELALAKVTFASLAPNFVGDFKKGVDYEGDIKEFSKQFAVHCDIAQSFGDYKVSIHTGSDKFSIYPEIGKLSNLHFHLKTAGTSWLQAMMLIAEKDPVFYRVIHHCAKTNMNETAKYYPVSSELKKFPDIEDLYDEDLPKLISSNEIVRQFLHISYGPILNNSSIRPLLFSHMHRYEELYHERIKDLFVKHLVSLGVPKLRTPKK